MPRKGMPAVAEYRQALQVIDSQLSDADRAALAAHAAAPGCDLDVVGIAKAAGALDEHWTYGEYSRVGRVLAQQMGLNEHDVGGLWTRALGVDTRDSRTNRVRWVMHPRLVAAVRKMSWGRDSRADDNWGITEDHVLAALGDLDRHVEHPFHDSTGYDLVHDGKRYPPKAVLGLAARHSTNVHLTPKDFSGGEKSKCFRVLRGLDFVIVPKPGSEAEQELNREIEREIEQRTDIRPTQKRQLVNARRGQGTYRRNLERNEKQCRVTGVDDLSHLRASHIKPWWASTDVEKLDGNNGLLLSPHIDHLFDHGWITFQDDGQMLVSPGLNLAVLTSWGIGPARNVGPFSARQGQYLAYHREHVFRK